MNQDFIAWVGQGRIADRTQEHLGPSDKGIIMQRQRFLSDNEAIAQGKDPKATIRDLEVNRCIRLPVAERDRLTTGLARDELMRHPVAVRQIGGVHLPVRSA
jgi:5,5'-dehydrodivanillate O-demethylase